MRTPRDREERRKHAERPGEDASADGLRLRVHADSSLPLPVAQHHHAEQPVERDGRREALVDAVLDGALQRRRRLLAERRQADLARTARARCRGTACRRRRSRRRPSGRRRCRDWPRGGASLRAAGPRASRRSPPGAGRLRVHAGCLPSASRWLHSSHLTIFGAAFDHSNFGTPYGTGHLAVAAADAVVDVVGDDAELALLERAEHAGAGARRIDAVHALRLHERRLARRRRTA